MTDQAFETRLASVLRADAERAVIPFDPIQIATAAAEAGSRRGRSRLPGWPFLAQPLRTALVLFLLLIAIAASVWVLTSGVLRRDPLVQAPPATSPVTADVAAKLTGTWLADQPDDLVVGGARAPALLSLTIDAGGTHAALKVSPSEQVRLFADVEPVADGLRLVTKAPSDPVVSGGINMAGCPAGDAATYSWSRSADGLRLTLDASSEGCAARAAILSRTWIRSLAAPNSGGLGVVDAIDQLFTVTLPSGSYEVDRRAGAITIVQTVPERQFLAFQDPQGFNDPCDAAAGRYKIQPGADAFVAYFRQLDGFTVDSTSELRVDGHRAVRLVVHANADASCPSGARIEWQPKLDPGGSSWFLLPGDTDSLVIVELPGSTLMFEVLPAPNPVEDEVIGSIRFLDQLPTTP